MGAVEVVEPENRLAERLSVCCECDLNSGCCAWICGVRGRLLLIVEATLLPLFGIVVEALDVDEADLGPAVMAAAMAG